MSIDHLRIGECRPKLLASVMGIRNGTVLTVLDPERVRAYAFNHYFQDGCMAV